MSVGFVPTMGALHLGHLKLIKASKKSCKITICSIFINPKQFNNHNDFINYPNTIEKDLRKLKNLDCDIVYTPDIADIYRKDEKTKKFDFGGLENSMEGKYRPGHFNGMAMIIEKFFKIIKPTQAFFGQKDLQQSQIVKKLVQKMHVPIEIITIPTARDKNGLAKSSRNNLLSKNAKNKAALIYNCLKYCVNNKDQGIIKLKSHIHNEFKKQQNIKLEYVEIVNIKTMCSINEWQEKNQNAICIAAYIDGIRLIDNIIL